MYVYALPKLSKHRQAIFAIHARSAPSCSQIDILFHLTMRQGRNPPHSINVFTKNLTYHNLTFIALDKLTSIIQGQRNCLIKSISSLHGGELRTASLIFALGFDLLTQRVNTILIIVLCYTRAIDDVNRLATKQEVIYLRD